MRLNSLLIAWINLFDIKLDIEISDLTLDSRAVKSGYLFIALNRGVEFIPQAIKNGAVAILIDEAIDINFDAAVPIIAIPQLQKHYGEIASRFYGDPSHELIVIGITGTNGKTSTSHYIAQLLQATCGRCGVIGTVGIGEIGALQNADMTTPDAITVHKTLKNFLAAGMKYVAMEVSSHALEQGRVGGVKFNTAIFTNLTQDHLDYHGTMENYGAAKMKLFTEFSPEYSIINIDDEFGKDLYRRGDLHGRPRASTRLAPTIGYSTQNKNADIFVTDIQFSPQGMRAELFSLWGNGDLNLPLLGEFNLSNMLASIAAVACQDVPLADILSAAEKIHPVAGRMQCVHVNNKPLAIIDYAHTPDALIKALQAIRKHCQGKVWCVFGCGGNRDKTKRPLMAIAAEQYADTVIVTSDNPRHEDADAIIEDILKGFIAIKPVIQADRATAIEYAIKHADLADVILIAGKGHEDYQIIGDKKQYFSDLEEVNKYVR